MIAGNFFFKKKLVITQCPFIYKNITKTMYIIYPVTIFYQIKYSKKISGSYKKILY